MLADIFRFLGLWFLISIPVGLLLGRFFVLRNAQDNAQFEAYLDKLSSAQFAAYSKKLGPVHFNSSSRQPGSLTPVSHVNKLNPTYSDPRPDWKKRHKVF